MKARNDFETTGHNRTIKITGIGGAPLSELTIQINYVLPESSGSSVTCAVVLDGTVIPAIMRALNGESDK